MADNGVYLKAGAVLGIVLVMAACAVLLSDDGTERSDIVDSGLHDQAVQQDTPEVQIATKYGSNISFNGQKGVKFTLTDCVKTANGLIFSFTNPYITPGQTPEGLMNLQGTDYTSRPDVYGKFNYSVDYSSGHQVITFNEDNTRDKVAPTVPLAWICGYSTPKVKPTVLDIPAVIVYGDDEYLVYGCFDGDQIWNTKSFFGKNTKLTATTVNFHIAYDHYVIPSTFFRENPYLAECNMDYVSADITWYQKKDSEGKPLDEPIKREYHSEGYLAYIGDMAFYLCKSAKVLNLPDRINFMGYNCFSAMSLREFVFDTSVRGFSSIPAKALGGGYCFSGNIYLEILTIGKNVDNLPANLFSKFTYSGKESCNIDSDNLRIVYNAGSRVTQKAVEDSIAASGSLAKHPVYLFNLFGGDLEVPATLGTQYLTMPTVSVHDGEHRAYIPAWRVNDTMNKVLTEERVDVGTENVLTVFNGISMVTYHLDEQLLGTQDLVCDYASKAYNGSEFPGFSDIFLLTNWNTSPDGTGTIYVPGQTIVTVVNLDLYAQGILLRNEFTITYQYSEQEGGVWYDVTATRTYTNGEDNHYALDATGLTVVSRTEGHTHEALDRFTHWLLVTAANDQPSDDIYYGKGNVIEQAKDATLRAVRENSAFRYSVTYTDGSAISTNVFYSRSHTPSVVLENVMFANGSRLFDCWMDPATGTTYQAGETVTLTKQKPDMALETVWKSGTTDILFNYGAGTGMTERQRNVALWGEVTLDTPHWIRTGFNFLGWSSAPDVEYPSYSPGMVVVISDTMLIPDPDNPGKTVFNLYAVWEGQFAGHVVVVMHDSMTVYDGMEHAVQSGYTVLGLDDEHTVSVDFVRCDADGSYMHTLPLQETNVGTYYYSAEVAIFNTEGVNDSVRFDVRVTIGYLTITNDSSYSSVIIES